MPNNNEEKHSQSDDGDSCDDVPNLEYNLEYNTFWYNPASPVDDGQQFGVDLSTDDDGRDDVDLSDIPELVDGTPPLPAIPYEPPMAAMDGRDRIAVGGLLGNGGEGGRSDQSRHVCVLESMAEVSPSLPVPGGSYG